ncbi:uncharacterized protein UV8b_03599 [Ustilaginoidea virens]|uniref:G-protein coupled receptors family 2 profile 2 domain-containing protein n=1 Tax=Ustilaginoidea virens TaxID=1159556 RepID=A0A8E5HQ70_USTVR|nr:uncharacterized protein UV8b_03599 [Ustilaginoidea virens]QUC19358.1 hypothetical protein UV8b_03599 [Ustilaginoidea virens]
MESSDDGSRLSAEHTNTLITIERTGAAMSMAAITVTVVSYAVFRRLRTTPNLFLFFASIANAGASVAAMMGYDGLRMGVNSSLCQTQGLLFEWFMQADPWWSCAMAVNVFLVFFNNANPATFRKYTWIYCVICYGGPMIPSVVLISIRGDPKGPVFGDAALWCWISPRWSIVRLYAYYIPIWICILLSVLIYIAVGCHVFRRRNQLLHFKIPKYDSISGSASPLDSGNRNSEDAGSTRPTKSYGRAVTEIHITSGFLGFDFEEGISAPPATHIVPSRACNRSWPTLLNDSELDRRAITAQNFVTTCSSGGQCTDRSTLAGKFGLLASTASMKLRRLDPVKMAYIRTSFIFGFSVLITWIPSSVNRLYSLANEGQVSYPLSIASGCVLPLQGVWNATIFFMTSWSALCDDVKAMSVRMGYGRYDSSRGTNRLASRLGVSSTDTCTEFKVSRCNGVQNCGCENCKSTSLQMVEPSISRDRHFIGSLKPQD